MKNKKYLIFTAIFCIAFAVIVSATAASYIKTIEVSTDIKLSLNGQAFTPKDSSGNPVEVFVYNGTTYVPIRAISEAFGCDVGYDGNTKTAIINEKGTSNIKTDNLSYGDTFVFDNLEITFHNNVIWSKDGNQFSDTYGNTVFGVPVTIKNIKDSTYGLNYFYYSQYGSKGTKLSYPPSYMENNVMYAGDMRSQATLDSIMYFMYDGDGDYWVEFSVWSFLDGETIEVKLPIAKP